MPGLRARARIEETERGLRAQIDVVARRAPINPPGSARDGRWRTQRGRDLTLALAGEHGPAAPVWLDPARSVVRRRGLPVLEHHFVDSFALEGRGQSERYVQMLRGLPVDSSEWTVHPGAGCSDTGAGRGGVGGALLRRRLLGLGAARQVIDEEGIVVDYRGPQQVWEAVARDA